LSVGRAGDVRFVMGESDIKHSELLKALERGEIMSHTDTNELDEIVVEIMYGKFEGARTINMGKVKAAKQQLLTWIESEKAKARLDEIETLVRAGNDFGLKSGSVTAGWAYIRDLMQDRIKELKQSFGIERKS
jgi:hypothetical protein